MFKYNYIIYIVYYVICQVYYVICYICSSILYYTISYYSMLNYSILCYMYIYIYMPGAGGQPALSYVCGTWGVLGTRRGYTVEASLKKTL